MEGCSSCSTLRSALVATDRIVPHVILGSLVVAGIGLFLLTTGLWWVGVILLVVGTGMAVDLAAHGYGH